MERVKMYLAEVCLQAACVQAIILDIGTKGQNQPQRSKSNIAQDTCCEIAPRNGQAANKT